MMQPNRASRATRTLARPLASALITLALFASGCGEAPTAQGQDSKGSGRGLDPVVRGEQVYKSTCASCHMTGLLGAKDLATTLASSRLRAAEFQTHVEALAKTAPEVHSANQEQLQAVLAAPEGPQRYAAWLTAYLDNPRFDRVQSRMNRLELSRTDMQALLAYLESRP